MWFFIVHLSSVIFKILQESQNELFILTAFKILLQDITSSDERFEKLEVTDAYMHSKLIFLSTTFAKN
jgi:hypothetical protein